MSSEGLYPSIEERVSLDSMENTENPSSEKSDLETMKESIKESAQLSSDLGTVLGAAVKVLGQDAFCTMLAPVGLGLAHAAEYIAMERQEIMEKLDNLELAGDSKEFVGYHESDTVMAQILANKIGFYKDEPLHKVKNLFSRWFSSEHTEETHSEVTETFFKKYVSEKLASEKALLIAYEKLSESEHIWIGENRGAFGRAMREKFSGEVQPFTNRANGYSNRAHLRRLQEEREQDKRMEMQEMEKEKPPPYTFEEPTVNRRTNLPLKPGESSPSGSDTEIKPTAPVEFTPLSDYRKQMMGTSSVLGVVMPTTLIYLTLFFLFLGFIAGNPITNEMRTSESPMLRASTELLKVTAVMKIIPSAEPPELAVTHMAQIETSTATNNSTSANTSIFLEASSTAETRPDQHSDKAVSQSLPTQSIKGSQTALSAVKSTSRSVDTSRTIPNHESSNITTSPSKPNNFENIPAANRGLALWVLPPYGATNFLFRLLAMNTTTVPPNMSSMSTTTTTKTVVEKIVEKVKETEVEEVYKVAEFLLLAHVLCWCLHRLYCTYKFLTRRCHACTVTDTYIHFNIGKGVFKIDNEGRVHTDSGSSGLCLCYTNTSYEVLLKYLNPTELRTDAHKKVVFSIYKAGSLFFILIEGVKGRVFNEEAEQYSSLILLLLALCFSGLLYTRYRVHGLLLSYLFFLLGNGTESFFGDLLLLEKCARIGACIVGFLTLLSLCMIKWHTASKLNVNRAPKGRFTKYKTLMKKTSLFTASRVRGTRRWVHLALGLIILSILVSTVLSEQLTCINTSPVKPKCVPLDGDAKGYYQEINIQPLVDAVAHLDAQGLSYRNFRVPVYAVSTPAKVYFARVDIAGTGLPILHFDTERIATTDFTYTGPEAVASMEPWNVSSLYGMGEPIIVTMTTRPTICTPDKRFCTHSEVLRMLYKYEHTTPRESRILGAWSYYSEVAKSCSTCVKLDDFNKWKGEITGSIDNIIKTEKLDRASIDANTHALVEVAGEITYLQSAAIKADQELFRIAGVQEYQKRVDDLVYGIEARIYAAEERYKRAATLLDTIRSDCDTGEPPRLAMGYIKRSLQKRLEPGTEIINSSIRLHLANNNVIVKYFVRPATCDMLLRYTYEPFEVCIFKQGSVGFGILTDLTVQANFDDTAAILSRPREFSDSSYNFRHIKMTQRLFSRRNISNQIKSFDISIDQYAKDVIPVASGFIELRAGAYFLAATRCKVDFNNGSRELVPGNIIHIPSNETLIIATCEDGHSVLNREPVQLPFPDHELFFPDTVFAEDSKSLTHQELNFKNPFNIDAFNRSQAQLSYYAHATIALAKSFLDNSTKINFTHPEYPDFLHSIGQLASGVVKGVLGIAGEVTSFASKLLTSTILGLLPYILSGVACALSLLAIFISCKGPETAKEIITSR